jgi:glycosyltransferase involved in cell wall biosynthesis
LAVVIPALNEAAHLPLLLAQLVEMPALVAEVLVVDGGSSDGTGAIARLAGARVTALAGGRGAQLAEGARQTTAPWLLFLHGDTRLPPAWGAAVTRALASPPAGWYFQLQIEAAGLGLTLLQMGVALRSSWLQRPYGDQGLLVRRDQYLAAGGFRPLPLMEDLDLVERLAGQLPLRCLGPGLLVAGRRWRRLGLLGCLWQNWRLRRAWRQGVGAETLAQRYYANR